MTYGQAGVTCPQCGSAAAVHSVAEWAAMAQGPMGGPGQAYGPQPGYGPPQPGFPDPSYPQQPGFPQPSPQSGFPDPSQYQQSGFPDPSQYQPPGSADPSRDQPPAPSAPPPPGQQPGYPAGPQPAQPPGYPAEPWQSQPPPRRTSSWDGMGGSSSLEDGIADAVLGAATRAIGRAISRRMRQTFNERVVPTVAARQEAVLRERMAVAQRHPDLCACLNDQVVFLAGGTRVLPLASALAVRTVEQSDALVAQLRG